MTQTMEQKIDVKLYRPVSEGCTISEPSTVYENIAIKWLMYDREKPVIPYEIGIEEYDGELPHVRRALDELFTEDEAKALSEYLSRTKGISCQMQEEELPLHPRAMGYIDGYDINCGITFLYELYEEPGYDLPFKVLAYCII